jgi:cation:H+ antiporter
MADVVQLAVGLAALLAGAWLVVHEAARLAVRAGLSPVVVGATVVAFGTSAPEFVVSALAASRGAPDLAIGTALGSNVANVGLVLGIGAAITSMTMRPRLRRWELPVLGVATLLALLFAANGAIGRLEGATLLGVLAVFVAGSAAIGAESVAAHEPAVRVDGGRRGGVPAREIVLLVAGVVALAGGAQVFVEGATGLAERLGVSELVIGALVVAVGTSLPEIATTTVAAWRGEHEIAIANAVGSNVFNLLGVVGLAALVAPLDVDRTLYQFEMPALLLSTVALVALSRRGALARREGAWLLGSYTVFVLVTFARG